MRCHRLHFAAFVSSHLVLPCAAMLCPSKAVAQTTPDAREHHGAAWFGLMTDWQLSGPWSLWFDTHYNTRAFVALRGGITHRFEPGPTVTAGYAHLWTRPGNFERNEHRPWAQLFMPFKFTNDWSVSQRLRLELRIRERTREGKVVPGWSEMLRWRSQTAISYWFAKAPSGDWFVQSALEILANGGQSAGPNFLDQNRASLMFGYKHEPFTVRIGYLDRFVPGTSGQSPVHEHNGVLWVNYRFYQLAAPAKPAKPAAPEIGNP